MSLLEPITKIIEICAAREAKNRFLTISPKINIWGDMLLQKSGINLAIANILMYRNSLYDLLGLKFKKLGDRQTPEKGMAQNALIASSTKMQWTPNVLSII